MISGILHGISCLPRRPLSTRIGGGLGAWPHDELRPSRFCAAQAPSLVFRPLRLRRAPWVGGVLGRPIPKEWWCSGSQQRHYQPPPLPYEASKASSSQGHGHPGSGGGGAGCKKETRGAGLHGFQDVGERKQGDRCATTLTEKYLGPGIWKSNLRKSKLIGRIWGLT